VLIIVEEDETDYVSQNHALMQQIELSKKIHQGTYRLFTDRRASDSNHRVGC
jgi:hypothetical protein